VRITLFGVEEANRLLADVRPRLDRLRRRKLAFDRMETRHAVLRMAAQGAAEANPDASELRSFLEKRARLARVIGRGIAELGEMGVLVKDLDAGLCDFYALKGDRLVFLCWRADEPEIAHWHGLEDGFSGRHPLKNAELG
jgi:hypothetical protein